MSDNISKKMRVIRSSDGKVVKIRTEGRGFGVIKTGIAALIILAQLAFLILLYLGFVYSIIWYYAVSAIADFICILHVLASKKPGAAKVIWTLFLSLFTLFGYIAYLMSSETIFFGNSKRRYADIFARTAKFNGDNALAENLPYPAKSDAEFLWNTGNFKVYKDTDLKYFPSGADLFDDVILTLKTAEKFVFIEYFIMSDGVLFNEIANILAEKVKAGVDVRIIVDGMGSHGTLSFKSRKRLVKAGIKFKVFNRLQSYFTFALNLRDHRKIIVVDGKTAYTGGSNLADEYVNAKRMYGYWKDTGIRIKGAAVDGLTLTFLRQWEEITKKEFDYTPFFNNYESYENTSAVIPYADGKDYDCDIAKGVYDNIIVGAREKLYIMTPYFIPDEHTAAAITDKALSGVDVRILLPGVPDKPYVYAVTKDNAQKLAKYGVKVYIMRHAFVHSKVMLSENCAAVGSVNIDLRSYYNQFENGIYTNDGTVLQDIETDFDFAFEASDILDGNEKKSLLSRLITGVLRLFSPLM